MHFTDHPIPYYTVLIVFIYCMNVMQKVLWFFCFFFRHQLIRYRNYTSLILKETFPHTMQHTCAHFTSLHYIITTYSAYIHTHILQFKKLFNWNLMRKVKKEQEKENRQFVWTFPIIWTLINPFLSIFFD